MTGPEHVQEAERLLEAGTLPEQERDYTAPSAEVIAAAQVHATLALVDAQTRVADFLDRLGVIAMHTVFAGWTEQEVADARAWVRALVEPSGGDQS